MLKMQLLVSMERVTKVKNWLYNKLVKKELLQEILVDREVPKLLINAITVANQDTGNNN